MLPLPLPPVPLPLLLLLPVLPPLLLPRMLQILHPTRTPAPSPHPDLVTYSDGWFRILTTDSQTPCTVYTTDTMAMAGAVAVVKTVPVAVAVAAAVAGGQ